MTTMQDLKLVLLVGRVVALPAPKILTEMLQSVEVTTEDEGRTSFQLSFTAQRSSFPIPDFPLMISQLLRPFNRIQLTLLLNGIPRVLSDGIITNQQLMPGDGQSEGTITVTGEDLSVLMDLHEEAIGYPGLGDGLIAGAILLKYAMYGIVPMVIPPLASPVKNPIDGVTRQVWTDRVMLDKLANDNGYTFFVKSGPLVPLLNIAYWGPSLQGIGPPQRTLNVDMGAATNVDSVSFSYDALAANTVQGEVLEELINTTLPVETFFSTKLPPLAIEDPLIFNLPYTRRKHMTESQSSAIEALAKAQGQTNKSTENVVTVQGELDGVRYGDVLTAHGIVGLRGAGFSNDGLYYVKTVKHTLSRGEFRTNFTLAREGQGSITPILPPF